VVAATKRKLLQVVDALGPPSRLAGGLNGRQQQRHQDANDGNHDQQFDQRKPARERALVKYYNTRPHDYERSHRPISYRVFDGEDEALEQNSNEQTVGYVADTTLS
jgi:hypothetical protein